MRTLLILPVLLALLSSAAAKLAGTKPNIVVVITDDQGYANVGANGHPWLETPHLDAMAAKSARFDRFLVAPTCSPTRAALMSGRHPMKNGITHTILERERMALSTVTLPTVLRDAGYATGMFGKWHLGDEEAYRPKQRGFDEVFQHGAGGIGQAYKCSCADAPGNKYFNPAILHNESFVKTSGYCSDLFFTAALGWMEEVKEGDKPFFTYISTNAPHGPFIAPPEYEEKFAKLGFNDKYQGYYGMIENIDDNMGRLIGKLEEWDLMEDTLVIFMSDNGQVGGQEKAKVGKRADGTELMGYNAGMRGGKGSADDGGCRVPMFLRWDGKLKAGQRLEQVCAHIDFFPTLAALGGADLPEGQVEGRSVLPLLEDADSEWPDRFLVTHKGRWKGEPEVDRRKNFAVRSHKFRLVGEKELFDMEADPGQTTNVIDQHPEVVAEMLKFYDAWWDETRPLMVNDGVEMSPTRPFHVMFEKQTAGGGIPAWEAPVVE